MKKTIKILFTGILVSGILLVSGCQNNNSNGMRHIVIFKYKSGTTQDQIDQVTKAFGELQNKIPGITAFEHGVNDSPEGKSLDFTHVYLLTFEDAAARDAYLPHPEHKKFGEMLGQLNVVEDVFVADYKPAGK